MKTNMFVITVLEAVIHIKFVGMFTIYLYAKFHMPNSYGSLDALTKLKTKFWFNVTTIVLFYVLQ
jgi:hypothetical protein